MQWLAYLDVGMLLLSDQGRALASIVDGRDVRLDALCGCSNRAGNDAKYGSGAVEGPAPNARDRFTVALAKFGLGRRDIHPNLNVFKGVRVLEGGALEFDGAPTAPGAYVDLRAEMRLLVVVAAIPHVLDPRPTYTCTPLRLTAWTGEPSTPEDPLWISTPEAERALRNTERYYLGGGE